MTLESSNVTAGTNAVADDHNDLRTDLVTGRDSIYTESDGATVTFDLSNGKTQQVTLGGNRTLALSNVNVGQTFKLKIIQDATGTRVPVWFSTINWDGDVAPTLSTVANSWDWFGFICTATDTYDGFVLGQGFA